MNFRRKKPRMCYTRRSKDAWHNLRRKHFLLRKIREKGEEKECVIVSETQGENINQHVLNIINQYNQLYAHNQ